MKSISNNMLEAFIDYLILAVLVLAIILVIRFLYKGLKSSQTWKKTIAIILSVLLFLSIIGGVVFYLYAIALGEAFKTGL